ncbi:sulfotransferase family protein [Psychroserpens sp. Hel_I_66]|uniref:sulfotransferase family protein n=1 Tax=Psychroserpens sp. Hel_I_66 TaxID=1250004 RepID=UPI00068FA4D5|nr:sulfotransferase [Psychroserpens sp. Hel_I_66]
MKVNFLIIGAAKSATTSLSNALALHPEICFSQPKEPQFFSKLEWRDHIDEYHKLFNCDSKLYGEGSTNYTKFPNFNKNVSADIFEYNPNMKLIYMMRNPIDRIISHYTHTYNRGYQKNSDIDHVITSEIQHINVSRYAMQIEPYLNVFGKEQVLLLFFEDFVSQPQKVLDTVYEFLNVGSFEVDTSKLNSNKSFNRWVLHYKYDNPKTLWQKIKKIGLIAKNYFNADFIDSKPKISEETKKYIVDSLTGDIKKIEKLTNRDLSHWLKY